MGIGFLKINVISARILYFNAAKAILMLLKKFFLPLIVFLSCCTTGFGQVDHTAADSTVKQYKIVVFTPLYLDSAFNGANYKLGTAFIPKYILPGLEFYNGVILAVDSLKKEGVSAEVIVVDTKQPQQQLNSLLRGDSLADAQLLIASFTSATEVKQLAEFALLHQIPLISATYPRTSGVVNNPYFYLVNSSLKTHLDGIYKHLQQHYAWANLVMFSRKSAGGNYVKATFGANNKATPAVPLKYKTVDVQDYFTAEDIATQLDSTKTNIIIAGDIDETFGLKLVQTLSSVKKGRIVVIGMPTWDRMTELNKESCKGIEIVYSTPYNFTENKSLSLYTQQQYKGRHYSRPSDMAFKGYEAVYHFTKLLVQYDSAFTSNINANTYKLFGEYQFTPFYNAAEKNTVDYYENRKLYFIKKIDGVIKAVN